MADSSVNLAVRSWVGPNTGRNRVLATDAVIVAVKNALDAAGVAIAYPTQTLHISPQRVSEPKDDAPPEAQRALLAPAGA